MGSAKQEQDIVVQVAENFEGINVSVPKLAKLVEAVCNRFELSQATVSIAIVGDAEIRRVSRQFLNRDNTTDCLSFNLSDKNGGSPKSFELVVNADKAVEEAKSRGHSGEAELALYITHGLLHNFGFDDSTQDQAERMHRAEDEILQQQGFGLVYNTKSK